MSLDENCLKDLIRNDVNYNVEKNNGEQGLKNLMRWVLNKIYFKEQQVQFEQRFHDLKAHENGKLVCSDCNVQIEIWNWLQL